MTRTSFVAVVLLSLLALAAAPSVAVAQQAEGLFLSTAYPAQEVRAGESINIQLQVRSAGLPAQVVDLEVTGTPEGWQAVFQGNSRIVHAVYVEPDVPRDVTLKIDVPDDAVDDTYRLTVVARGDGRQAQLPLELTVGAMQPPQLSVEADLPVLKGTPSTTFNYRLRVKNESNEDTLVSLEAEAPEGFQVTLKTGAQEVTSLPIKAGETENIDVSIRALGNLAAGEYPFRVHANGSQASGVIDLTAVVTGQPSLALSGLDGRLSGRANAGRETPLEIIVRNDGSAPANNVRLEASPPASWNVAFEPEVIPALAPNEELKVVAHITPPESAVAGDYMLTLRAVPAAGSTESAEFRVTVLTSTLWGVVALGFIAAALGVVALAVARFGRR